MGAFINFFLKHQDSYMKRNRALNLDDQVNFRKTKTQYC